jgi:thiamine pyrophosphate-dependent acetolactate synthase large subunit-like protein
MAAAAAAMLPPTRAAAEVLYEAQRAVRGAGGGAAFSIPLKLFLSVVYFPVCSNQMTQGAEKNCHPTLLTHTHTHR